MTFPSHPSASLDVFLTHDHRACDKTWNAVEADPTPEGFVRFDRQLRRHLDWEEQVLFPAFEKATGMFGMGPTEVMRSEHHGMRGMLDQMAEAVASGDRQELLDLGDTLMMLIQQHNVKEEQMLYPMMSSRISGEWPDLLAKLRASDV